MNNTKLRGSKHVLIQHAANELPSLKDDARFFTVFSPPRLLGDLGLSSEAQRGPSAGQVLQHGRDLPKILGEDGHGIVFSLSSKKKKKKN